jgi:hypothetical protein
MAYIYKLKINGKSYVGSTNNIKERIEKHKSCCCNTNDISYNIKVYKFIRENGGWDNVDIHILQKCNKSVKRIVEDFYMKHYNCELNDRSAILDVEKYKEYLKEYAKKYHQENKEYIKEYKKIWFENNKEELNKKFICMCGGKYIKRHKSTHIKTKKHQQYLQNLSSSLVLSSSSSSAV